MIGPFFFIVWVALVLVPLYWFIPARFAKARLVLLNLTSLLLVWRLSPTALLFVLLYALLVLAFARLNRANVPASRLKQASWLLFLPLLLTDLVPAPAFTDLVLGSAWTESDHFAIMAFAGASFAAIRAFIIVREDILEPKAHFLEVLATLSFFGAFLAGPISGSHPWRDRAQVPAFGDLAAGVSRIGWGGALFLVARPLLANLDIQSALGFAKNGAAFAWADLYRDFLVLYIDFAGYTEMALGFALLFGVKLPENFRYPLLSRSIREFWQRWHMSLGAFISTYLFKPLVRRTGKPHMAIFLAFIFVGLWHRVSAPYLLWGLGHGLALAANLAIRRSLARPGHTPIVGMAFGISGWAFTISYVALLSSIALSRDLGEVVSLLARLGGY